jgi:hypothetical protein
MVESGRRARQVSLDAKHEPELSLGSITNVVVPILKKHGVTRAGLFGSVVHGNLRPVSDIDLLVELPEDASLFDLAGFGLDLEEALGRRVDILTYRSLHPRFRERILSGLFMILLASD